MECDAHSYPHQCTSNERRRLPTGGDSAVIVCRAGYHLEIAVRRRRNMDLEPTCRFDLPAWADLEVYA